MSGERSWQPEVLGGRDPSGLSYAVIDEIEGGILGLAVSEWPRVDAQGRVRFAQPPVLLGGDRASFERFLAEHRRPSELAERPLRIGDVFAVRARPEQLREAAEAESRLEPVLAPEEWIEPPVYDVTADAREAAKAAYYAAVTPPLAPGQVAQLEHLVEHGTSASPPPPPPPAPPRRSLGFRLLQIGAAAAVFAVGIGVGVAFGGSTHEVTNTGSVNRTNVVRSTSSTTSTNLTTSTSLTVSTSFTTSTEFTTSTIFTTVPAPPPPTPPPPPPASIG